MTLPAGTTLGPYEIVALLGAGGMGEVYRARDKRLDREVALKVLSSHLSNDPAARQRFDREARTISSLNHPHICTLYDVGHHDGIDFLVMEYLEGQTLADRLRKGPLPIEQLLKHAADICDGLERAHRHGIVHRDLKPGNIMLTKGEVKLMDFGLAKSRSMASPPSSGLTASLNTPADHPLTAEGTLVGTFQYMSPEQVEGNEADARSDIFALGAVMYEMATGKRAFEGKTTASVIAAVLASEPQPISAIEPMSPAALDRLIRTCLAKDPENRFQNVHDLKLQLKWIAESGSQAGAPVALTAPRKNRERIAWIAACAILALLVLALVFVRQSAPPDRVVRATIPAPENADFEVSGPNRAIAVSADGRIAFVARSGGVTLLWVRPLDSFKSFALVGTDGAYSPFWSPDGHNVAFFSQGKLKRVAASGGPVITICDLCEGRGGSWNRQDVIIFAKFPGEIYRVPASGGQPTPVTRLDTLRHDTTHRWPHFLPDGNHFVYMAGALGLASDENVLKLGSLDGKTDRILLHGSSPIAYDSGYLLFVVNKNLVARAFDAEKLEFAGDPVTVVEDVLYDLMYSNASFSASGTGILVYQTGNASADRKLEVLDTTGRALGTLGEAGHIFDPRSSPDGKRIAFSLSDPNTGKADVWIQEVSTGNRTRITSDARASVGPIWSHDGKAVVYYSMRIQNKPSIYEMPSNGMGVEQKIWEPTRWGWPDDFTPESSTLVVEESLEQGKSRISLLPLGKQDQPNALLEAPGVLCCARLSADGHWIAYVSDESGRREVYLSSFPKPAGRLQVSSTGGRLPSWRGDGKELYYLDGDSHLIAAELKTSNGSVEVIRHRTLFQFKRLTTGYDAFPDGEKFLWAAPTSDVPVPLSLVLNWTADLKK
ncbi:MAG TPA: protein kinase [Candidatus Sulfotelmatobacter sp.]|nr:protein kinase [Candidatus Sulfotelmatobacter sp.]